MFIIHLFCSAFSDGHLATTATSRRSLSLLYHSFTDRTYSVTILDHASHAIRRKSFAPHFALGNLMQFEPEMQEHTLELISVCFSSVFLLTRSLHFCTRPSILSPENHRWNASASSDNL